MPTPTLLGELHTKSPVRAGTRRDLCGCPSKVADGVVRSERGGYLVDTAARYDEVGDAAEVTAVDAAHADGDPAHRVVVLEVHAEGHLGDRLRAFEAGPGGGERPPLFRVQQ